MSGNDKGIGQLVGRHIATVKGCREEGALRVDLEFSEGGTLTLRLSQDPPNYMPPNFSNWRVLLKRGPGEIRMGWENPTGGQYHCCDDHSTNEQELTDALKNRELRSIGPRNGAFGLELDDGFWLPFVDYVRAKLIRQPETCYAVEFQL